MANHFSALKRARQTERRTQRNRSNSSRLRSALRDMREALAKGDKAAAEQVFRKTTSSLDKAIQKGVLHDNTAARYKSRLNARLVDDVHECSTLPPTSLFPQIFKPTS